MTTLLLLLLLPSSHCEGSPWDWQSGNVRVSKPTWHPDPASAPKSTLVTLVTRANVSARVGQDVQLPCKVHNLREYTVSWLRSRDTSVLAVGALTFSSDSRFQVLHILDEQLHQYNLEIKNVQKGDSGWYDCQVNTEPKVSSRTFLRVHNNKVSMFNAPRANSKASRQKARTQIAGPSRIAVQEGSTLRLSCKVKGANKSATVLYWRHETRVMVDAKNVEIAGNENNVELVVANVSNAHAGEYACINDVAAPAIVHVLIEASRSATTADLAEALASGTVAISLSVNLILLLMLIIPSLITSN